MGNVDIRELEYDSKNTRLQLNLTYPALVALIGGDTEAEIKLRQNIVERFTDKYLRGLVNDDSIKEARYIIIAEIKKQIEEKIGKIKGGRFGYSGGWRNEVILNEDIKREINECCESALKNQVKEAATKALAKIDASAIEAEIQRLVEYYVNHSIKERVKEKVREVMKQLDSDS